MAGRDKIVEEVIRSFHSLKKQVHKKVEQVNESSITHSQYLLLSLIQTKKSITVKELATQLNVTNSGVTQFIDTLETSGLVTRTQDALDKRTVQITLSENGKKEVQSLKKLHHQALRDVFSPLTDEELHTLHLLLKKVQVTL